MNRTEIEWCTHTSNPVQGQCLYKCGYCYVEPLRQRFGWSRDITFNPDELAAIRKRQKPATIFIGSTHDVFGPWIGDTWINTIIDVTRESRQHTFLFLTKNPERYSRFYFPENCYRGCTDDGREFKGRVHSIDFVSFEPIIGSNINLDMSGIRQVIIGAMTGKKAVKPDITVVKRILNTADNQGIPVFIKDNMHQACPGAFPVRQELVWRISG